MDEKGGFFLLVVAMMAAEMVSPNGIRNNVRSANGVPNGGEHKKRDLAKKA